MKAYEVPEENVIRTMERLDREAEEGGYHLNPDTELVKKLVRGILINEMRYGYWNCPCRLASGDKKEDLDIICPCYYRDADVDEYGACYCALYVDEDIKGGKKKAQPVPERRPSPEVRKKLAGEARRPAEFPTRLSYPVWRCNVCGYLCARDTPPAVCPVCKAKKERFERFL